MNICLSLKYVVRRPAFCAPVPVPHDKKDAWGRCHASSDSLSPQPVHWCRVLCTTQLARHDQPPKWSKIQILSCLEWQAGWKWSVASNFTILSFFSLSLSTILKECKFRRDAFLFLQKNHTKMTAVRSVVFFFTIIAHVCAIKQLEMRSNLIVPVLQFINIIPWPSIPVLPMEDWISGWLWNYRNHCITVFCSVFISNGLISCYFTV